MCSARGSASSFVRTPHRSMPTSISISSSNVEPQPRRRAVELVDVADVVDGDE